MLFDFFIDALIAGVGIAVMVGPLGCVVVWRRLSFFADTLAHASLLGVALALFFDLHASIAVDIVIVAIAFTLVWFLQRKYYPPDLILAIFSHSALAMGLIALAFITQPPSLLGFLYGDILAVTMQDIFVIYIGGAAMLVVLGLMWQRLFALSVSPDVAAAETTNSGKVNTVFVLLLALVIAMATKIVGVLLIAALLLIPAATARRVCAGPEAMAVVATGIGVVSVVSGLFVSLYFDTPSGPSIVATAFVLFLLVNLASARKSIG